MKNDPFEKIRLLAEKFYKGWRWSTRNTYSQKDYEDFYNYIEMPLNQEVIDLLSRKYSLLEIDEILIKSKNAVWFK